MSVFIGGDTYQLEYDFSTKVTGSTAECPLRLYRNVFAGSINPDHLGSEMLVFQQSDYDKIKTQNNISFTQQNANVGAFQEYMIELDLDPLCNSFYGGSHEALKNAIRRLEVNVWASGSGNNGGVVGYKCLISPFAYVETPFWAGLGDFRSTNSQIKRITYDSGQGVYSRNKLSPDNRIYVLIKSGYPASSTIPSILSLDSVKIYLTLARTPDVLKFTDSEGNKNDYINVNLKDEWSVLVKGFSPAWNSENWNYNDWGHIRIEKDTTNKLFLLETITQASKAFRSTCYINGKANVLTSFREVFDKFTSMQFLFQKKGNKLQIYRKLNGQSMKKTELPADELYIIEGASKLYMSPNLNTFTTSPVFFNYAIAQNDQEAEIILKGRNDIDVNDEVLNRLAKQFENPNLSKSFNDGWRISANATLSNDNKKLILNATGAYQNSDIHVPVFPNNKYKLNGIKSEGNSFIVAIEYYNNISLGINHYYTDDPFVISSMCNDLCVQVGSRESGTFTFSDIELKRID